MKKPTEEMTDPVRLLAPESDAPPAVREVLAAAKADLPSDAALAALAARLAPLTGGGGDTGGAPGGSPRTPVEPAPVVPTLGATPWGLVGAGVVAATLVATLTWSVLRSPSPPAAAPAPEAQEEAPPTPPPSEAASSPVAPVAVPALAPPDPTPSPDPAAQRAARAGSTAPPEAPAASVTPPGTEAPPPLPTVAPPPDLDAELALVRRAQDALRDDPSRALVLTGEHASRFPDGALAQEREVVAIQALASLGRRDEARTRAAEFAVRWPGSAHLRRLDVMVGTGAPPDR